MRVLHGCQPDFDRFSTKRNKTQDAECIFASFYGSPPTMTHETSPDLGYISPYAWRFGGTTGSKIYSSCERERDVRHGKKTPSFNLKYQVCASSLDSPTSSRGFGSPRIDEKRGDLLRFCLCDLGMNGPRATRVMYTRQTNLSYHISPAELSGRLTVTDPSLERQAYCTTRKGLRRANIRTEQPLASTFSCVCVLVGRFACLSCLLRHCWLRSLVVLRNI